MAFPIETRMSRRTLLKSLGAAGATAAFPALLASCSKNETSGGGGGSAGGIQIVSLYGTSGAGADFGKNAQMGFNLIPKVFSKDSLGRDLNLKHFDTQDKVDVVIRRVREAASQGTPFFVGGFLSSTGLATGKEVYKQGGVYASTVGANEFTGSECNASSFRWSASAYTAVHTTVTPLIQENPALKRWYTITPDYVFGQTMLETVQDVLQDEGVEHVGNSFHGLDTTEFSSYINNAVAAKPDVLCLLNFSDQATTTLQQAVSFGLKKNMTIILVWGGNITQFRALGADVTEDVYVGAQYWHTVDVPGNQKFLELFRDEYGITPGQDHTAGFVTAKMIIDGVAKANSTEPADVVAAMEGMEYEGLTGQETIRAEDHQVIKDHYLLKGKSPSAMKDEDDYADIIAKGNTPLPVEEANCTMTPLGTS